MQHNARKMCILGTYVQRLVAFLSIFLFFVPLYIGVHAFLWSHIWSMHALLTLDVATYLIMKVLCMLLHDHP